jgi:hypothetical protein
MAAVFVGIKIQCGSSSCSNGGGVDDQHERRTSPERNSISLTGSAITAIMRGGVPATDDQEGVLNATVHTDDGTYVV